MSKLDNIRETFPQDERCNEVDPEHKHYECSRAAKHRGIHEAWLGHDLGTCISYVWGIPEVDDKRFDPHGMNR